MKTIETRIEELEHRRRAGDAAHFTRLVRCRDEATMMAYWSEHHEGRKLPADLKRRVMAAKAALAAHYQKLCDVEIEEPRG